MKTLNIDHWSDIKYQMSINCVVILSVITGIILKKRRGSQGPTIFINICGYTRVFPLLSILHAASPGLSVQLLPWALTIIFFMQDVEVRQAQSSAFLSVCRSVPSWTARTTPVSLRDPGFYVLQRVIMLHLFSWVLRRRKELVRHRSLRGRWSPQQAAVRCQR